MFWKNQHPANKQLQSNVHFPYVWLKNFPAQFDRMTRMVAEKRISDVLFELEMKENSFQPFGQYQLQPAPAEPTDPVGSISSPYINHMLQNTNYRWFNDFI